MRLDIVFTLVDCAEPDTAAWYRAAARMMLDSARHAFAGHDVRYVQMTDGASEMQDVDIRFTPSQKAVPQSELAQYRGLCTAEWALQADRPAILCDVDVLWNNDDITQVMNADLKGTPPDIVLFSRQHNPFQPYNGGLIITQPGQTAFWTTYKQMMGETLPVECRKWWGDQIALTCMCGTPEPGRNGALKFGSRVAFVPIDLVAPSPKSEPTQLLETSSVHFKGWKKRRPWMSSYYELLNQSWSARAAAE